MQTVDGNSFHRSKRRSRLPGLLGISRFDCGKPDGGGKNYYPPLNADHERSPSKEIIQCRIPEKSSKDSKLLLCPDNYSLA